MTLEESIEITVKGKGLNLYDIVTLKDNDQLIYRVLISSPDGISLDQCSEISHMISPILDLHEPLNGAYYLEVSSPGIERKLKKQQHFLASIGENIRLKKNDTSTLKGQLIDANQTSITLLDAQTHTNISLTYEEIISASTYYDWDTASR